MTSKQSDNGASPIIEVLLARMNALGRFSDNNHVITGRALLPLDVVVDEMGEFGFVSEATEYGHDEDGNPRWSVHFAGHVPMIMYRGRNKMVRTIYASEVANATAHLIKYFGDKECF